MTGVLDLLEAPGREAVELLEFGEEPDVAPGLLTPGSEASEVVSGSFVVDVGVGGSELCLHEKKI